jgi:hypothetical protein
VRRHLVGPVRRDVHHDDAVLRGGGHVDVVDAGARPADHPKRVDLPEHPLGDGRPDVDDQSGCPRRGVDHLGLGPGERRLGFGIGLGEPFPTQREVDHLRVADDDSVGHGRC